MDQGFFAHSVLQCNEEAGTLYVGLHLTDNTECSNNVKLTATNSPLGPLKLSTQP